MATKRYATGLASFVLTALIATQCVYAASPVEQLRSALGEMHAWLDQNESGPGWRTYLRSTDLEAQVAKDPAPDGKLVAEILGRYASSEKGIDAPLIVKTRNALALWYAETYTVSAEALPATVRAAKATYLAYTPTDLEAAKTALVEALERLDQRLKADGPSAPDWRNYTELDKLQAQMQRAGGPELPVLDAAYVRFSAGHEGLRLVCFADVRDALRKYIVTARAVGQPKVRASYEMLLDRLAGQIETYRKAPTVENTLAVDLSVEWLDRAGQAPWVAKAIRREFSKPNLQVAVSRGLIASRLARPVDDTSPVRDNILGTDIHGTGHTTGEITVELAPSTDQAIIDLIFQGQVESDTVGYNGPVQLYSTGKTALAARKRLVFNSERLGTLPSVTAAVTNTSINNIDANNRALIERIAQRRATTRKGEAEQIAARHAEERFNARFDEQVDSVLTKADLNFQEKVRGPLMERRLFPGLFTMSTTAEELRLVVRADGDGSLASPSDPPAQPESVDLAVRVHESAINNTLDAAIGGMVVSEKRFRELLTERLGLKLPPKPAAAEDDEELAITYAEKLPIAVSFNDGGFTVTVAGREYGGPDKKYPGMNVTATYKIHKKDSDFKAVRQGKLVVLPPGFTPGGGRELSARQQAFRTVLERRFERLFEEELVPHNIVLPGEKQGPLELRLTHWEASRGWLLMAWKKAPVSKPEAKQATPPAKKAETSAKKAETPAKASPAPAKAAESPVKAPATPMKAPEKSVQAAPAPAKAASAPAKAPESPVKAAPAPAVKTPGTPAKPAPAPAKAAKSMLNRVLRLVRT